MKRFLRSKFFLTLTSMVLLFCALALSLATSSLLHTHAASAISLGTADSFGVLAGSMVTNTGTTVVTGNVGVSPGAAVTGFPPGTVTPPGTIHLGDAVATQAQSDLTTAYNTAAAEACTDNLTGQDLGGLTLVSGVYCFSSSAQLTGTLTLNGQGDPSSIFIFQIGSTLTTASGSRVMLINGASPCNVFWQVGSSATLGTGTSFAGNILALTSITANTGATVINGGLYARNGAVTLDTNTITKLPCNSGGTGTGGTGTGGTGTGGTGTGGTGTGGTGTGGTGTGGTGTGDTGTGDTGTGGTGTGGTGGTGSGITDVISDLFGGLFGGSRTPHHPTSRGEAPGRITVPDQQLEHGCESNTNDCHPHQCESSTNDCHPHQCESNTNDCRAKAKWKSFDSTKSKYSSSSKTTVITRS